MQTPQSRPDMQAVNRDPRVRASFDESTNHEESAPSIHIPRTADEEIPAAEIMAETFTLAQQELFNKAIADAVAKPLSAARAAPPTGSPSPATEENRDRRTRPLTADLFPPVDYFLPVIEGGIPAVEPWKVTYPKHLFSDHKGPIQYEAWKMDMKFLLKNTPVISPMKKISSAPTSAAPPERLRP